jgi:hypothetical protein|eukprot:5808131-Prymnesium_polylepis.1
MSHAPAGESAAAFPCVLCERVCVAPETEWGVADMLAYDWDIACVCKYVVPIPWTPLQSLSENSRVGGCPRASGRERE